MSALEIKHTFSQSDCITIARILKSNALSNALTSVGIKAYRLWQLGCSNTEKQFITYGFSIEVSPENTQKAYQTVTPFFKDSHLALRLSGPFIGISPEGVTKGTGLKQFLQHHKIPLSQVIGIGDGGYINGNDVSFLSLPGLTAVYVGNEPADKTVQQKETKKQFYNYAGNTAGTLKFLNNHAELIATKTVLAIDVDGTVATEDPQDSDNCILDPGIHTQLLKSLKENPELIIVFLTARGNITYIDSVEDTQFNTKKLGIFFNDLTHANWHHRAHIIGLDGGLSIHWCSKTGQINPTECRKYSHHDISAQDILTVMR